MNVEVKIPEKAQEDIFCNSNQIHVVLDGMCLYMYSTDTYRWIIGPFMLLPKAMHIL